MHCVPTLGAEPDTRSAADRLGVRRVKEADADCHRGAGWPEGCSKRKVIGASVRALRS
jgi:hypothetical protein